MKKLGFCLLALCLVGYTVGCGKSGEEGTAPAPNNSGTDTTNTEDAEPATTEPGADAGAEGTTN